MKQKKILLLAGIGLYLLSTGLAYTIFTAISRAQMATVFTSPLPTEETGATTSRKAMVEVAGPQTEVCPLNGAKYTKVERKIWETRRPLAVMIENHLEARPQSGLSDSDIIYEAVAEGGITRFLALFYCHAAAYETIIGPIRSARTYFLDWASEYNQPLYVHVGGANTPGPANALGEIESYGWSGENDLNQFSIGFPTFWRDYERLGHTVATEHTMYSTSEKLWAVGQNRGYTNVDPEDNNWLDDFTPWKFVKNEPDVDERGQTNEISFNFWDDEAYAVTWQYDKEANQYKRLNGGQSHKDLNVDQQLTAKNVVIQFMTERNANDGYPGNIHLLYGTIGQGKALVFKDGEAITANWSKAKRTQRTIFTDAKGKEIEFNPGRIWISTLPVGTEVKY
jgi:hypothetical protein